VTHLTKTHKFLNREMAACRMNSHRMGGYYAHTKDIAQVDCTRCAKLGGFAPKAKAAAANPGGTCQVCFAGQRVIKGVNITLHGYTRPGCGYIIGDCPGSKELPFEKSCDITRRHRKFLDTVLADYQKRLGDLQGGSITSFEYTYETREENPEYQWGAAGKWGKRYLEATITVKLGDQRQRNLGRYVGGVPGFEDILKRKIQETEHSIWNVEDNMEFLDGKLAGWAVKDLLK
jgi:hypothetical protein